MTATDELREAINELRVECKAEKEGYGYTWYTEPTRDRFGEIADRIDAALEGYVELPKDADGEAIHIGDYLHSDESGKDFPCRGFSLTLMQGVRWWTVESCYDAYSGTSEFVSAKSCHHVQPDSWEAIIEAAASYGDKRWFSGTQGDKAIIAELVERCKRLAGEDE